jgi:8-amino-7-oxononanoate synthase
MRTVEPIEARVRAELLNLEHGGLLRTLHAPGGIDLASNDYLGLAGHPLIRARVAEALLRYGCGSTGSRLLRGHRDCFTEIEQRFAQFKGTESALYFSSGYLANLAVLSTFPQPGDIIFSDASNHASLIDGMRLSKAQRVIFPHNDVGALQEAMLRAMRDEPSAGQRFIVTESLFSMDGDIADLRAYAGMGAALIVDEAHAAGVYGERGSGLIEHYGVENSVFLSVNSAGKGLGVAGAFVAGPAWAIEYLIQRARPFIFSTAPPPAIAAGISAALDLIAAEPERRQNVLALAQHLRRKIDVPGSSQIIPLIFGENRRACEAAEALQAAGFDVRAIRPPTVPSGTARLRISVNAQLSASDLDRFAETLSTKTTWRAGFSPGGASAPVPIGGALASLPERDSSPTRTKVRPPIASSTVRGLFVTGTDTGVGKTVVSAALMSRFRGRMALRYWKPVQTGIEQDDDTAEVQRLSGCSEDELFREGVRLRHPVSPHLAAAWAGERIDAQVLSRLVRHLVYPGRWVIEGAGGVLVPLNDSETILDLIAALNVPIVIVARSTLGTINHTLLTIAALRAHGLCIAGIVMTGEEADNQRAIEHYGGVRVLGQMPRFNVVTPETVAQWAAGCLDPEDTLAEFLQ